RESGDRVHLRGIRDLLERIARHTRLREDPEAGAGVAERPRRQFDRLFGETVGDCGEGGHGRPRRSGWRYRSPSIMNRFNTWQDNRMPEAAATVADVAALAGVSVGTVSNVLNGRVRVSPDVTRR